MGIGKETGDNLKERLSQRLGELYEGQMGMRPQEVETSFAGNLILVRYKGTLSPSEIHFLDQQDGRLLLRELNERICQELYPQFDVLIQELTGCRLMNVRMELFPEWREKLFLFTLSGSVEPTQEI